MPSDVPIITFVFLLEGPWASVSGQPIAPTYPRIVIGQPVRDMKAGPHQSYAQFPSLVIITDDENRMHSIIIRCKEITDVYDLCANVSKCDVLIGCNILTGVMGVVIVGV